MNKNRAKHNNAGNMEGVLSMIPYLFVMGAIGIIRVLPHDAALLFGRCMGVLGWALDPVHRGIVRVQMKTALGKGYHASMPLKVFMNQGEFMVDIIRFFYMDDETLKKIVDIEGRDHLEQAISTGRGIVFITGHIGSWQVLSHIPRLMGLDYSTMADLVKNPRLAALLSDIFGSGGVSIMPPKGGVTEMLEREIQEGRHVCITIDQRGNRSNGLFCDMFGLPAPTTPLPAFVALKTNALIVPVYSMKVGDRYRVYFSEPVEPASFGDDFTGIDTLRDAARSSAVRGLSGYMQSWLETIVRAHPEHWFWVHSRWARRKDMQKLLKKGNAFAAYVKKTAEMQRKG
ncbi:MAG: lysophospholipid acyltransferase family protein [Thermodesulfobacteriota bacterium]|nr:lysophospholipid acyltransferase family protein [Thermodesulfobacteriota bacterium]